MLNDPQENFNVAGKPENAEVTMFFIVIKPTLDELLPGDRKSELEAEIWLENRGLDNFIVGRAFTNQAKKTDMKQKLKLHHAFINWMCWPNKNLNPGALHYAFSHVIDFLEIHRCKNSFLAHFIVKSIHSFFR